MSPRFSGRTSKTGERPSVPGPSLEPPSCQEQLEVQLVLPNSWLARAELEGIQVGKRWWMSPSAGSLPAPSDRGQECSVLKLSGVRLLGGGIAVARRPV